MKRSVLFFASALFLAGAMPVASLADTELTGEKGGAFFRIVVPEPWNKKLVIWGHGFSLSPLEEPVSDIGPLAALQLAEGYAVAASSYSQVGWALFRTERDYKSLIKIFRKNFGKPKQILLNGASLGGIVTAQALEKRPRGAKFAGAYPICGAMAGSRNWDGALDLRLIYDEVCSGVPGAAIPGGPEGLPAGFNPTPTELGLAVHACTGILAPPTIRTAEQAARLAKILTTTTLPENFLLTDMGFSTFALSDLTHDRGKLKGRIGVGNERVDYGDADINAGIQRVRPHAGARKKLMKHFTPRGRVHDTKIVSLHTDKDGLVVVENETEYAQVVPASQLTTAVVVESVPSHCGFTEAEVVAGWEALRGWVAGLPKPTAASIQGICQGLQAGGVASGPCRIDPTFLLQDLDTRIPPR